MTSRAGESPLHSAAMAEDKWLALYLRRRRWIERAGWMSFLLGSAAVNTVIARMDLARAGLHVEAWEPAVWEFSSAFLWIAILPWLVRAADTKPLRWGRLKRHLPWHLLFALITSVVHVLGMVGLRKVAYATQGAHYDFGDWPVEFFYEALKDLRSYAFILTVVGAYRLLVWRWQGEASLLAEAPGAAPASLPSPAVGSNRNPNLDPSPSPSLVRQTSPPSLPMPTSLASAAEAEPAREPDPAPAPPSLPRPERLLVKKLGKEFLLPMDEIEWIQACGNYVNLHRQQHDYPLRSSLGAFEQRIDPREFVRVHRSYLVRLRLIEAIEPTEAGDAHLRLRDGSRLPCSRTYLERLRQRLA